MKTTRFFLFLFFYCLISPFSQAQSRIVCKVVGISDGDTLTCLHGKTRLKTRLLHIDAPEAAQPFGNKARQALAARVFKKQVTLHTDGVDRYRRTLAVVFDEQGRDINLALVEAGMAWAYGEAPPRYTQAMARAQRQKNGLWRDKAPIRPAEWRQRRENKRSDSSRILQNSKQKQPLAGAPDCSRKRSCRSMPDYATAERYYRLCGWTALDGNGDGIPCNKLYREAMQN